MTVNEKISFLKILDLKVMAHIDDGLDDNVGSGHISHLSVLKGYSQCSMLEATSVLLKNHVMLQSFLGLPLAKQALESIIWRRRQLSEKRMIYSMILANCKLKKKTGNICGNMFLYI